MSDERIKVLEEKIIQQSFKIDTHDKDLSSIARSLEGINSQMTRTNELFHELAMMDERARTEITRLEHRVCSKVEALVERESNIKTRLSTIEGIINRITWAIVSFVGFGVLYAIVKFSA